MRERERKHFIFGRFRVLSDMFYSFGTNAMYLCVFALSGYFLIQGELSLGAASASLLYTGNLIGAIGDVLSCVNVLNSSKGIVEELENDLKTPRLGQSHNVISFVPKNINTQWLIDVFVRLSDFKNNLINCAEVGLRTFI